MPTRKLINLSIIMLLTLSACSTTKNLPEGETLYTGIKDIHVNEKDISENGEKTLEEVTAAVSVAPNNSFFGSAKHRIPIPFGLWVYNNFQKYEKGLGRWIFRKLAATPVTVSSVNPETRTKIASNLLKDYGYFDGNVTYSVDSTKNPRAVKLSYEISMGRPYLIDTVTYEGFPERADRIIRKHFDERLVRSNQNFDVTLLNSERERLVNLFKDNGYYFFRGEYISFLADTLMRVGVREPEDCAGREYPEGGEEAVRDWDNGGKADRLQRGAAGGLYLRQGLYGALLRQETGAEIRSAEEKIYLQERRDVFAHKAELHAGGAGKARGVQVQ